MKRAWLITLLFCLLLLGGGAAVVLLPRVVPRSQCSDLYRRYADTDGVDATFIKDYQLLCTFGAHAGDTVPVAVTMLAARTDAAWDMLRRDFRIVTPDSIHSTAAPVSFMFAPRGNYAAPADTALLNNDIVMVSYASRTVAVFSLESEEQINAIVSYQISNLK